MKFSCNVSPEAREKSTNDSTADTPSTDLLDMHQQPVERLVQSLLEGPFKHLLGHGIKALSRDIQQQVRQTFAGWNVQEKVSIASKLQ